MADAVKTKLTEADERASLIERLYGTEAHAQILDVTQEQPLTKLLREVRQFLERQSPRGEEPRQ